MNIKTIKIAVSGAGGGVGQSIIKSLQDTDYEVVALDGEALAAGLYSVKTSYIIPYSKNPDYIDRVIEICLKENCKLFFPGLDAELAVLSAQKDRFERAGITVIVSTPDVIALSNNKQLTYTELTQRGFLVPRTVDLSTTSIDDLDLPYPYILKEREDGARSQNLYIVKSKTELEGILIKGVNLKAYIAQEYIEGDEYTCGSVNLDGKCKGVIVMRRILRDGDTYKCFSVKDDYIESEVRKIMNDIHPFGACNVQLRVKDGKVYVLEINARCSGTTAARTLSGFNEPKMIADYLLKGNEPAYRIVEQSILRYWKELVVSNATIEELRTKGTLHSEEHLRL